MPRLVLAAAFACFLVLAATAAAKRTVYFTTGAPTPGFAQVWSVSASGGQAKLLRRQMPVSPEGGVAALSRNGRKIFCVCRKDEVDSIRTDGTHLRRVGALPRAIRYDVVTLGPDGTAYWIKRFTNVFSLAPGAGKPRVFRAVRNSESVVDERIVPSPNGRRIAYVVYGCLGRTCRDGNLETLLTAKPDGSDRTVVYQSSGLGKEIREVAWSADGRRLVFSDGTGEGDPKEELPVEYPDQYFVAPADGSNRQGTPISLPAEALNPFFSPDAGRLAVTISSESKYELRSVPTGSTEGSLLTRPRCRPEICYYAPRVFGWR